MRSPTTNPFEPGSDRVPAVGAGRHAQLADWRDRLRPRRQGGQGERGRTLLGEPGIGTSVLVRRIADHAVEEGDLVTDQVRIPRGVDPLPLLGRALLAAADTAGLPDRRDASIEAVLRRVRRLTAGGVGVELAAGEGPPAHVALFELLVALGRACMRDGRVLLVHVDEEVTAPSGQRLVVALPIAVYLTGLPEFHDRASSRTGATFARRFQRLLARLPELERALLEAMARLAPEERTATTIARALGYERASQIGPTAQRLDTVRGILSRGKPYSFRIGAVEAYLTDRWPWTR